MTPEATPPGTEDDSVAVHARRKSLVDEIVSALSAEIVGARYEPGERILHQDLARRFNVSLGPIREALLKLEKERLVEIIPRRGARIVRLTLEQVEDLMAVRCAIYPVLARGAAMRASDQEIEDIREAIRRVATSLRDAARYEKIQKHAYATRQLLASVSRNDWAASIAQSSVRQPNWIYGARSVESAEEREQAAVAWESLGKAIASRRPELAAEAARATVLRTITTALPKLYTEHGLADEEVASRLRLFPAFANDLMFSRHTD